MASGRLDWQVVAIHVSDSRDRDRVTIDAARGHRRVGASHVQRRNVDRAERERAQIVSGNIEVVRTRFADPGEQRMAVGPRHSHADCRFHYIAEADLCLE